MSTWQPIETAPDNQRVLVFDTDYAIRIAIKEGDDWWSGYDCYGNDVELYCITHWMPLPAPPTSAPAANTQETQG